MSRQQCGYLMFVTKRNPDTLGSDAVKRLRMFIERNFGLAASRRYPLRIIRHRVPGETETDSPKSRASSQMCRVPCNATAGAYACAGQNCPPLRRFRGSIRFGKVLDHLCFALTDNEQR